MRMHYPHILRNGAELPLEQYDHDHLCLGIAEEPPALSFLDSSFPSFKSMAHRLHCLKSDF
jgi:hypothetical protein